MMEVHPKNVASGLARSTKFEPLYDVDPSTGTTFEVFFADQVFAGMRRGWYWWSCKRGSLPEWPPVGPFGTSYGAYRDALENRSGVVRPLGSPYSLAAPDRPTRPVSSIV
jgi:hypothetical protein